MFDVQTHDATLIASRHIVTNHPHKIIRGNEIAIYNARRVCVARVYVNDDASVRVIMGRVEFDDAGHIEIG